MRIAIPLDENKQDVCIVLARAPYFLFREDGNDTIVENPAAQAHGGAGIQAAQFLVDNGVNVPILLAVPATIFIAASTVKQFKSVIFSFAIASTCSHVTVATFLRLGSAEPLFIFAISSN